MTKAKTITSALLATLLIAGSSLPVKAEGDDTSSVTKNESVYTVLNADGSVKKITVSDTLHSDSGFSNYTDTSDLSDVENLKSTDAVTSTNGGYTWTTDSTDIYYQGTSTKDLPLNVKITYTLNDKEYSAEDMIGKSGHVKIKISVENTSKQTFTVGDKSYDLVTPFITGAGAMLDEDNFSNVEVNHGTVTSDSSHSIVAGVLIPGLRDGLESVLDGDTMSKLSDYLIDDITIEADTTNFESPTLMLAAATSTDALKEDFADTDLTSIFDQLDELKDATDQLISGSKTLSDGANTLADGASQLNDGASTLLDGTSTLSDGTNQLANGGQTLVNGANQLSSGAASLQAGLATLVGSNDTLISGANTICDTVLASVQSQLREQLNDNSITLTWDNYDTVLASYNNISDEMRSTAKKTVSDSIKEVSPNLTDDQINGILYLCARNQCTSDEQIKVYLTNNASTFATAQKVNAASQNASNVMSVINGRIMDLAVYEGAVGTYVAKFNVTKAQAESLWLAQSAGQDISDETTRQNIIDNSPENARGIDDSNVMKVVSGMRKQDSYNDKTLYDALCNTLSSDGIGITDATEQAIFLTVAGTLHSDVTSLADAFNATASDIETAKLVQTAIEDSQEEDGVKLINGMLNALALPELQSNLAKVTTQLQQVAAFKAGVKQYTDGVSSAYTGSQQLAAGLATLSEGVDSLNSGIQKVNSGAESLNDGASTLKNGTQSLTDGANQLSEGAKTLYDGLVQYNDEAISKLTDDSRISNMEDAADLLNAVKEQGSSYNNYSGISDGTDGSVKFVYKVEGAKATTTTTTTEDTTEKKTSFWDRIVKLFDFSSLFASK